MVEGGAKKAKIIGKFGKVVQSGAEEYKTTSNKRLNRFSQRRKDVGEMRQIQNQTTESVIGNVKSTLSFLFALFSTDLQSD